MSLHETSYLICKLVQLCKTAFCKTHFHPDLIVSVRAVSANRQAFYFASEYIYSSLTIVVLTGQLRRQSAVMPSRRQASKEQCCPGQLISETRQNKRTVRAECTHIALISATLNLLCVLLVHREVRKSDRSTSGRQLECTSNAADYQRASGGVACADNNESSATRSVSTAITHA